MTLRSRLTAAVAAPSIALLLAFSAIVYWRVQADQLRDLDDTLGARAAALAAQVEHAEGRWETEFGDAGPDAGVVGTLAAWRITALPEGRVLGSKGDLAAPELRVWSGDFAARTEREDDDPVDEVTGEPAARVQVTVAASLAPLHGELRGLLITLLGVGAVLSATALAAAILLARQLVEPIEFARVQDALQRQTRFTADASHELRTPLAVLRSEAEVALRRERAPAEYEDTLRAVVVAVVRLQELVDGLLVLARVDGDVRSDDRVDLFEIVRTAADAYEDPRIVVHGGPTPLRGDARLLDVLIRNLLSNALRHTPTGGEVVVAVTPVSAGARLEVSDNGEGIPASAAPHVFDRFYRVDDARDRARGGAGLGLSIVQAIALVHGGRASLRSAPGAGTKVTVDFSDAGRPADGRSAP